MVCKLRKNFPNRNAIFSLCETSCAARFKPGCDVTFWWMIQIRKFQKSSAPPLDASKCSVWVCVTHSDRQGPPGSLSLWLVLSPPAASAWNGQVLHLVWCSLRALITLKCPKKSEQLFPQKSLVHKSRVSKCIIHGSV